MRQIVLDTETTGLEPEQGHRVIEIGCVELVYRRATGRQFHKYLNPERAVDAGAVEVHGLTDEFLADKPLFADVAEEFLAFVDGGELVIHNAEFDVGFLNHELRRWRGDGEELRERCSVLDTLSLARRLHPGQRNSLDALCRRYMVDNSRRDLHGALLDAQILADVYLAMTGGQTALTLDADEAAGGSTEGVVQHARVEREGLVLATPELSGDDAAAHEAMLDFLAKQSGRVPLWRGHGTVADE